MTTTAQKIKYTLYNDRSEFEGEIEVVSIDAIEKGDYVTEHRNDRNNNLPVFFPITNIGPNGVHERMHWLEENGIVYSLSPYQTEVTRLVKKREKVVYETGATSHAINDLILFTDNTRELAQLRNSTYEAMWQLDLMDKSGSKHEWDAIHLFDKLFKAAKAAYCLQFDAESSQHILRIGASGKYEFCQLYLKEYDNWKVENGYTK